MPKQMPNLTLEEWAFVRDMETGPMAPDGGQSSLRRLNQVVQRWEEIIATNPKLRRKRLCPEKASPPRVTPPP